jgi:hypothetical protein
MSVVATKAISAKLFVGTLELHSHLVDHTSEEIAADIISEVNKVMESYQARNPREPYSAPRFPSEVEEDERGQRAARDS